MKMKRNKESHPYIFVFNMSPCRYTFTSKVQRYSNVISSCRLGCRLVPIDIHLLQSVAVCPQIVCQVSTKNRTMHIRKKQRCRDGVINDFLSWCSMFCFSSFHEVTSLHPLHLREMIFPLYTVLRSGSRLAVCQFSSSMRLQVADPALTKLSIPCRSAARIDHVVYSYTAGHSQYPHMYYWHHALYMPKLLHFSVIIELRIIQL